MADEFVPIRGRVIDPRTGGVPGLLVQAWLDLALPRARFLMEAPTRDEGAFALAFHRAEFERSREHRGVFFKVLADSGRAEPLASSGESIRWFPGQGDPEIFLDPGRRPTGQSASTEVAFHELGQSIAVSVASVQQELDRYPNSMGVFVLDEVEIEIPVRLRVDGFGQVRATVVDDQVQNSSVGLIRLRVRPVPQQSQLPEVTSDQSLSELGVLSEDDIERLAEMRIYSVDDLLRAARNPLGRRLLAGLQLKAPIQELISRSALLSLAVLPERVSLALIKSGIASPHQFVTADPGSLAEQLSSSLEQKILAEHVKEWQEQVRKIIAVPLPPVSGNND